VQTRSPQVDRLVKSAFELLLSNHRLDCRNCPKRKGCALLQIARERGLKMKLSRLEPLEQEVAVDESLKTFAFDRSLWRSLWPAASGYAGKVAKVGALGFTHRGISRRVSTFQDLSLAESPCTECGLCVEACPSGALYFKR